MIQGIVHPAPSRHALSQVAHVASPGFHLEMHPRRSLESLQILGGGEGVLGIGQDDRRDADPRQVRAAGAAGVVVVPVPETRLGRGVDRIAIPKGGPWGDGAIRRM